MLLFVRRLVVNYLYDCCLLFYLFMLFVMVIVDVFLLCLFNFFCVLC